MPHRDRMSFRETKIIVQVTHVVMANPVLPADECKMKYGRVFVLLNRKCKLSL